MEWHYREENQAAAFAREAYAESLQKLVRQRRMQEDARRTTFAEEILRAPEAARKQFVEMLGWPLTEYVPAQPLQVKSTLLHTEEAAQLQRLQLELWPGFWFEGLLFLHTDGRQHPFVLCQHGGAGTPELCSGLLPMGSANYNDMTQRVFERGANVFSPQLYLWSTELFGGEAGQQGKTRDEIRRALDATLKNLGGSIMAVELTCLRRCLDYFETMPWVLPGALGMVGLSYGGQYTLFLSAVEPRLRAALSSCYFNDRHTIEWPDYTWFDAAGHFLDAEIALLSHPRKLFLQVGKQDPTFRVDGAAREWQRLRQLCGEKTEWVDFQMFDGEHEFDRDNTQLERFMAAVQSGEA